MSLSVQFLSLLAMIGTGIVTATFIDMIRVGTSHAGKKSIIKRRAAWFESIGWIIAGCWAFYVLFTVRDGAWRMYDPFAQISGMFLYVSVFYKPIRFIGRIILILILKPIWFVIYGIYTIIKKIIQFIWKTILLLLTPIFHPVLKFIKKYSRNPFKNKRK
jgi:hypothetical protein